MNSRVQFAAIDTDDEPLHRFKVGKTPGAWLRDRLLDGRRAGLIKIPFSADEPCTYGKTATTDLWRDVALFDRSGERRSSAAASARACIRRWSVGTRRMPAPLLFLETATRSPEWTKLREDGRKTMVTCASRYRRTVQRVQRMMQFPGADRGKARNRWRDFMCHRTRPATSS